MLTHLTAIMLDGSFLFSGSGVARHVAGALFEVRRQRSWRVGAFLLENPFDCRVRDVRLNSCELAGFCDIGCRDPGLVHPFTTGERRYRDRHLVAALLDRATIELQLECMSIPPGYPAILALDEQLI